MTAATMEAEALACGYGVSAVIDDVSLRIAPGELVAVLGPNGAGKSTLLRTLLGFQPRLRGELRLSSDPLEQLSRQEIARRVAFVPQRDEAAFSMSARDLVAMGRTPWLGRFRPEGPEDRRAVADAMAEAEIEGLADRSVEQLSGGERQRVRLARAFAQTTAGLVLDEPTTSLDLRHAFDLLERLQRRARRGSAVLVAVHDLTLASRFADRVVILAGGAVAASGPPGEVITEALMARVFGVDATIHRAPDGSLAIVVRASR
jgi:iron complex transport system ATP-binding protein